MKAWQYVSLVVVGLAMVGLIGFALNGFFTHPGAPMWSKVLIAVCVVGFVSLLGYVVVDRYKGKKKEPEDIKEVKH